MCQHWLALLYGREAIALAGFTCAEIVSIDAEGGYMVWLRKKGLKFSSSDLLRDAHIHNAESCQDARTRQTLNLLDGCESDAVKMQILILSNKFNGRGFLKAFQELKQSHPTWFFL